MNEPYRPDAFYGSASERNALAWEAYDTGVIRSQSEIATVLEILQGIETDCLQSMYAIDDGAFGKDGEVSECIRFIKNKLIR